MSQPKNRYEARSWHQTVQDDLKAAQALREAKLFAHACFQAQQCAEKAIKALWITRFTPGQSFHRQDADQAIEIATSFLTISAKIMGGLNSTA